VRRRDFTIGLLLATAVRTVRAQERAKQHWVAIVVAGSVASIDDPVGRDEPLAVRAWIIGTGIGGSSLARFENGIRDCKISAHNLLPTVPKSMP
jgi:hypothetical protein